MNWFNIVNFILALAPQEIALVKAVVDAAHAGHQAGTPLQPVPTPYVATIAVPTTIQPQKETQSAVGTVMDLLNQDAQKETPSAVVEPPANGVKKTL